MLEPNPNEALRKLHNQIKLFSQPIFVSTYICLKKIEDLMCLNKKRKKNKEQMYEVVM